MVFTTRRTANSHQNFVYVDGSGSLNQNINPSVSNQLFVDNAILAIAGGNQFNGVIDDVRVYGRELSFTEVNAIYNSYVNIPDTNFKAELVNNSNINTDGDSEISYLEAQAFTGTIDVPNRSISDLTGIGAFPNISILYVNNNQLTSLDVSNNLSLTTIYFNNNNLVDVDLSLNTNLTRIYANNNQLNSLNVANGNNANMSAMRAQSNNLVCIQHDTGFNPTTNSQWTKDSTTNWSTSCTVSCASIVNIPDTNFKNALLAHGTTITGIGISDIDTDGDGEICTTEATAYTGTINVSNQNISDLTGIEAFTALTVFRCHDNSSLTSLNVSQNTALTELLCSSNSLTSLDISQNTALTGLYCTNNSLTSLNVSQNTALTELYCYSNNLTSLNVANGNNGNLMYMQAQNNQNLTCIQHDTGFNPTTAGNWAKDASANWSTNCGLSVDDYSFDNNLVVYPNPATEIVNISTTYGAISKIEVFSVLGKKVLETKQLKIDISKMEDGIYFFRIENEIGETVVKKIVKQ